MESVIENYLNYANTLKRNVPEVLRGKRRRLLQIQTQLGKPLIQAKTASEIDQAIISAASLRKHVYNGGYYDPNAGGLRNRMAEVAVDFYRWAYGEALIERNPYVKNNHRKPPRREAHHLLENQIESVIAVETDLSLKNRVIFHLFLDTGLRVSEACRIKLQDIDFDNLFIRVHMTKVDRLKTVLFTEPTKKLLSEWLEKRRKGTDWLFPGANGKHLTTNAVRLIFRKVGKQLGFRMNPHSLRHTMGTLWTDKGADLKSVMEQLGHIDGRAGLHYIHLSMKRRKQVHQMVTEKIRIKA